MPLFIPSLAWVCALVLGRLEIISLVWLVIPIIILLFWRKLSLFVFVLGLLWSSLYLAQDKADLHMDHSWLNQNINIQAKIQSLQHTKQYTRLRLTDIQRKDGQHLAAWVDVYVYHQHFDLKPDMLIAGSVKLHKPHNKQNPAYFDYEQYAFDQHIAAVGSIKDLQIVSAHISWLEQLRQKVRAAALYLDQAQQGVLLALLLGDRSQIPLAIYDAFAASGAAHLLAISGLHMGLVAGWGFILVWWLMTRREAWIVRFPVRLVALSAGLTLALAYATLAGWPIPAQRAFLMLIAGVIAWFMRAKQVPMNTMFAALITITCFDPTAVFSVSLWLSFAATAALLIWLQKSAQPSWGLKRFGKAIQAMLSVSLLAALATLPMIGFVFERLPVWGLFANALLLPLYALWVLPTALLGELLALFGFADAARYVFHFSGLGIDWGNQLLLAVHTWPAGNLWLRSDLPWMFICLGLALIVAGVFWFKQKRVFTAIILLVSLGLYAGVLLTEHKPQQANLYVWDVGQGASALLSLPDFQLVVDVPGKKGSKFNGGTIAAQNMRKLGLLHTDALLLTHAQSDHAGGAFRLLESLNDTGEIWLADVPENHVYFKVMAQKHTVRWLKRGDSFDKPDVKVQVLWPPKDYAPRNSNNASLVLLLSLNTGQSILLAGDMEAPVERAILADISQVDVMLMPHHGSKTSSTLPFVKKVRPKIVVAQTGFHNHYGFPKGEVVQRYQDVGSQVLNTADGYVAIQFSKQGIKVQ